MINKISERGQPFVQNKKSNKREMVQNNYLPYCLLSAVTTHQCPWEHFFITDHTMRKLSNLVQ